MTARDHNKLLGVFFAIHAGLQGFGILMIVLIYGGLGAAMAVSGRNQDKTVGLFFLVAAVFAFIFGVILIIPQIIAAFKTLKNKPKAKFWATFAAIVSLLSFPFGTALGVYGLWFLFGEQGKRFYESGGDNAVSGFNPPPPPNGWQ